MTRPDLKQCNRDEGDDDRPVSASIPPIRPRSVFHREPSRRGSDRTGPRSIAGRAIREGVAGSSPRETRQKLGTSVTLKIFDDAVVWVAGSVVLGTVETIPP